MEILGLIPARGGSKSVPRKNIKPLLGRPLIAWTIEAAHQSQLVNRVIVSTDDEEIAQVAMTYGAEVPFLRPAEISQDLSTDLEFINHTLEWLQKNENYKPDIIVRLPPTAPLRTARHIDEGVRTLLDTPGADSVRPVCETDKHPYKFWNIEEGSPFLKPFLPTSFTSFEQPHSLPRQLFPKVYRHTGSMDVIWTKTIQEQQSTQGTNVGYFFVDEEDAVNIDYPLDFIMAEALLNKRLSR